MVAAGASEWDREGRLIGRRDVSLSERGRDQAVALASWFAELHAGETTLWEIVTSPLQRAVRTAEAIGEAIGLEPARDQRLTAVDAGALQGRLLTELIPDQSGTLLYCDAEGSPPPAAEPVAAAKSRIAAAVEQARADGGDAMIVVADAGVVDLVVATLCGASAESREATPPGSVTAISFAAATGTWSLGERRVFAPGDASSAGVSR